MVSSLGLFTKLITFSHQINTFFDQIVKRLQEKGIHELRAEFISTSKNQQVEKFYDNLGFTPISSEKNKCQYLLKLSEYESKQINYILVTEQ